MNRTEIAGIMFVGKIAGPIPIINRPRVQAIRAGTIERELLDINLHAVAGSCVKQVRCHFDGLEQTDEVKHVRQHTYELVEFLHDILKAESFPWAEFHHSVAIHNSCSSLRGLGIARTSEVMGPPFDKTAALLSKVKGLVVVPVDRPDDCCGFGGTFCVTDEAVSARMGIEKAHDHVRHGAEYVVSPDMSCLMHQQGIAQRAGLDLKYIHVAQVLNGGPY